MSNGNSWFGHGRDDIWNHSVKSGMDTENSNHCAQDLAEEVLTLNPEVGELGEGKARRLIELAERVLESMENEQ